MGHGGEYRAACRKNQKRNERAEQEAAQNSARPDYPDVKPPHHEKQMMGRTDP